MTEKRRNGNEPSQTRAAATSAAEAAAFGTAAGAIVLGVTEAQARHKDAEAAEAVHELGRTASDVQNAAVTSNGHVGEAPPLKIAAMGELQGGRPGVTHDMAPRITPGDHRADGPTASETDTSAARDDAGGSDGGATQEAVSSGAEAVASSAAVAISGDRGPISGSAGAGSVPLSSFDPAVLSDRIAGEITAAVGKITQGIAEGLAPEEIGTSVAEQVRDTVSLITKDIETALSGVSEHAQDLTSGLAHDLSDGIGANVADALAPVADITQPALEAVPSFAAVAGQVDDIVETGLSSSLDLALKEVADIPASLLGAEAASDLPGGILSDIFYSDGAAEASGIATAGAPASAPVAPAVDVLSGTNDVLSEAAASTVDTTSDLSLIDFTGVSYSDTPDSAYGGMTSGLNALHLL